MSQEELKKRADRAKELILKRRNLEYILAYSNATPFLWSKSKYSCFYCLQQIKDPDNLREHTSSKHKSENLELVIFDRTAKTTKDSAVKLDVKDLTCKLCSKKMNNVDYFISHIVVSHDADYDASVENCVLPFILDKVQPTCASCNTKFVFFEYLLRHANKMHLSHNYICDICGTSFQGENHLRMHSRYYHKEGGYKCEYCYVSLTTLSQKLLHEKNVHELRMLNCPHCSERFKSSYGKKQHMAKVHQVAELNIKCPYCPKMFPQESIMSRHMRRVHLKEKNVKCDVCNDMFFNSYDLKLHMIKHNGQKNHVCNVCGKKFAKKSNLNTHALVHTGKKDFLCEVCHKTFALLGNLKVHLKNMHPRAASTAELEYDKTHNVDITYTDNVILVDAQEQTQYETAGENEEAVIEYLDDNQETIESENDEKHIGVTLVKYENENEVDYEQLEPEAEVQISQLDDSQVQITSLDGTQIGQLLIDGVQVKDLGPNVKLVAVTTDGYTQMHLVTDING